MPDKATKHILDRIARGVEALVEHTCGAGPRNEAFLKELKRAGFILSDDPSTDPLRSDYHGSFTDPFWRTYRTAAAQAKEAGTMLQGTRDEAKKRMESAGWKYWQVPGCKYPTPTLCSFCSTHWLDPITNGRFSFDDAARLQAERSGA